MKTLQTSIILNEVLNSAKDKCDGIIEAVNKVQKEIEFIIDMGLIDFDYRALDANVILAINEGLYSTEEELYNTLLLLKHISKKYKEEMLTFGQIG